MIIRAQEELSFLLHFLSKGFLEQQVATMMDSTDVGGLLDEVEGSSNLVEKQKDEVEDGIEVGTPPTGNPYSCP